jgi:hypothetical protein
LRLISKRSGKVHPKQKGNQTFGFEEALVQVVNPGGDADTAGTVVGALAGAAYGYQSIPDKWRTALGCEWPIASNQYFVTVDFIRIALQLAGIGSFCSINTPTMGLVTYNPVTTWMSQVPGVRFSIVV